MPASTSTAAAPSWLPWRICAADSRRRSRICRRRPTRPPMRHSPSAGSGGRPPRPFRPPATRRAMRAIASGWRRPWRLPALTWSPGCAGSASSPRSDRSPTTPTRCAARWMRFLDEFDFADLHAVAPEVAEELEAVAADAGRRALAQVGAASREELVDRVNTQRCRSQGSGRRDGRDALRRRRHSCRRPTRGW